MNDAPSPSGKAGDFDSPIAGSTPAGATCTKPAWMQTTVSMRAFLLAGAGCFSTPSRGGVLVPPPECLIRPYLKERRNKKQERRQQLPFLTGTRTGTGTGTGTCAGTCTGTARFATFILAKVAFARFATFILAKVAFARFATFILAKVAFARFATFCRKIRRRSLKEGGSAFPDRYKIDLPDGTKRKDLMREGRTVGGALAAGAGGAAWGFSTAQVPPAGHTRKRRLPGR